MNLLRAILKKILSALAPATVIVWFIVVGPLSFIILLLAAYAIVTKSSTLLIIPIFFLIFPPILILAWAISTWATGRKEGWIRKEIIAPGDDWWTVRHGYRILYEAYFA